ncbi:MAG: DUF4406 domain-containing protein [Atopobiaceae bacterium]|nr:DUF4406 domain-containing protein [Atopobiaceae bacterium]
MTREEMLDRLDAYDDPFHDERAVEHARNMRTFGRPDRPAGRRPATMMRAVDGYDFKDKNVYLSGPMTGHEDWNRAEFNRFAWHLRDMGAGYVYNPGDYAPHGEDRKGHDFWMRRSLNELTEESYDGDGTPFYDCIALMPGWRTSKGSMDEYHVARACGIEAVSLA